MFDRIKGLLALVGISRKAEKEYKKLKQEAKKMEAESGKKWYQSRTMWFNIISGAIGVASAFQNSVLASDPKIQAGFALFVTIGNAVLRTITSEPITGK